MLIDVAANRRARKWTRGEQIRRILWALCTPLFAWSPRPLWLWRVALLRAFGATIGRDVHIYPSARIAMPWNLTIGNGSAIGDRVQVYNLGSIRLGSQVTISQNVHLCGGTHDHRDSAFPLIKSAITVEDGAWLCADAFVGPDVTIGNDAILGARSVAMRSVPAGAIAVGHPARVVGTRYDERPADRA